MTKIPDSRSSCRAAACRLAVVLALAFVVGVVDRSFAVTHEVIIEATRLEPQLLRTAVDQRVTFVNRSGRAVHLDLLGDRGQHHVFQVAGSIWALFHRPGRHQYVVHFPAGEAPDLHGVVDVHSALESDRDPPICNGMTVMDVCIAQ